MIEMNRNHSAIKEFASIVGANPSITISNSAIQNSELLSLIRANTDIAIMDSRLSQKAWPLLAQMLAQSTSLKTLNLNNNAIKDVTVAKALAQSKSLKELNLYYNKIGEEAAVTFASELSKSPSLEMLNLSYNDIGGEAKESLRHYLNQRHYRSFF